MTSPPRTRISATVLGAPDARALAHFYTQLLGWLVVEDENDWVKLANPDGGVGLSFQSEPDHVAPVWPARPGDQRMMVHLDIAVDDLDVGVAWAIEAGAALADQQPQDDVRVLLDPAGHPFCLFSAPFA